MPCHGRWDVPSGFREGRNFPARRRLARGVRMALHPWSAAPHARNAPGRLGWGVPEYLESGGRDPRLRLIPVPETLFVPNLAPLCPGGNSTKGRFSFRICSQNLSFLGPEDRERDVATQM